MLTHLRTARTALEAVARGFEPAGCSGREAVELMEELGTIHRLTDGITARVAKRIADTEAHVSRGDRSAAEFCARTIGVGAGETKRAIENANQLERLPETDAAVRAGRLSARQAQLIAAAAVHDPSAEAELIEVADQGLVALQDACVKARARMEDQDCRSRRQHAARSLRMWNAADGMVEGHFKLAPEVGGGLKAAIDVQTRKVFRDKRRDGTRDGTRESHDAYAADALVELVLGMPGDEQAADQKTAARRSADYTTRVLIDHAALARGDALAGETCEIPGVGPVDAKWVQDLLGEAFVTVIIKNGKDITTVAHIGRHIPAELRTAMIASGRECSVGGCTGRDYLELDHCDVDFADGGPTALWNLAWLCSIHHKRKTQGWHLGPPDPATRKRKLDPPGASRAA